MLAGTVERGQRVANVPKKKFCGKEQVAKEVAGGLNGFGALLVMRKLMALLGLV